MIEDKCVLVVADFFEQSQKGSRTILNLECAVPRVDTNCFLKSVVDF